MIENIPACNELNPLAMGLIGRLNTSEFVNGGMPPAKMSLRWSVKTFDASGLPIYRQQPSTTVNNRQQPTTNRQQPTTTVNNRQQPTTTVNNRQQ